MIKPGGYMEQSIDLSSVGNARELGGYAVDGGTICRGVLLRTASLATISDEDKKVLSEKYRVKTVIDLRMNTERNQAPDPEIPGAKNLFCPVMELADFKGYDPKYEDIMTDPKVDRLEIMKAAVEMGTISDQLYVDFLYSERGKVAYRKIFEELYDLADDGAILWHCTDGKDRTGCAAMLLLYALGASEETIYADYLLTNEYHAAALEAVRKKAEPYHLTPDKTDLLLFLSGGVSRCYLENGIKAICEHFGSVEGYLAGALGVGEEEQKIIRSRFLV